MHVRNVAIVWVWAFGLFTLGFITSVFLAKEPHQGERITEAQYREQSLQYLEDIRNSLETYGN